MAMRSWFWLSAALCALLVSSLSAPPPAGAQEPARFDALVFSKTTGFRHESAIAAGKIALQQMGAAEGFNVTLSEDASVFTDAGLRDYEVVVFLDDDGEGILDAAQRTAFERWTSRGGGIVAIHADANADRNWAWKVDMMGGALFKDHPAGALQFQDATVRVEDPNHPATQGIPAAWVRNDEWYNFTAEPRGKVHVLLTLDESTYDEQDGSAEADDHPIAWCSNYDGGRHFYTALGHDGAHWQEPFYRSHILGAIEWAAGEEPGDCGAPREGLPTDASFDKVTLDDTTENPMEIAVAPDRTVYTVELAGKIKRYNPATGGVSVVGTIPVHRGNENGLLGITLDPGFATNRWIYLFYSAPTPEEQHVSRFTLASDGTVDMASEKVLLRIPHQRVICCHSSGSLTFGPDGNLYISTGDDTQHADSQGFAPLDDRLHNEVVSDNVDAKHAFDSRRSSGNTNDLRGKILRITPKDDGTYAIPAGNLFPPFASDPEKTRPEIYTMGHRNPFRIQVDPETGWLYNGEVGPDANNDNAGRGPRGYDELNQIRSAGNMGWPFCIANNKPYIDWTFPSGPSGAAFDCAGGPTNDSAWNTGLSQVPPAKPAMLYWPYGSSPDFPQIPNGPGRTAIAGPTYHYDAANPSEVKFPSWYDDKVFFADWSRDWMATLELDAAGNPAPNGITEFMPLADFRHVQDMAFGPDGALYVLEWGRDFNYAGAGINPDSGLYRIEYAKGNRTPKAKASADKDSGQPDLTVQFSSDGSSDPDGDALTYLWDFGDDSPTSTAPNPAHTYTEPGSYTAQLTVTDEAGKSASSTVVIVVGNTRPSVVLTAPAQGGLYDWGDDIAFEVDVSDPEDGPIDCDKVEVFPGVFHDEGGNAHVHPGVSTTGCEGTIEVAEESGHAKSANIALVLTATYTDAGAPGSESLTGADTHRLSPKQMQVEHFNGQSGVQVADVASAEGGRSVGSADAGDWVYFDPISLGQITQATLRYASTTGGAVQFRLDAPDGPIVGTAALPGTGGANAYGTVTAPIAETAAGPHRLYLVFVAQPGGATTNLFNLDELTFGGKGVSQDSAPTASIVPSVTSGPIPLAVDFTGQGADPEGTAVTYAWDFESDGTVDATTKDASHTYTTPGTKAAKLTVRDAGGKARSVTVDIRAYMPIVACAGDDDFLGTSLDTSRWSTVVRRDDQFLSVSGGALNIDAQKLDIHGGDQGLPNIVLQDLPATGPWTATARVTWNPTINYQNAGLMVYLNDGAFIKTGQVFSGGRRFEAFKEQNNSPAGLGSTGVLAAAFPTTWYIRLVSSDGQAVQAQYSPDNVTWTNIGNATDMNGLAGAKVGMYATASTQAAATTNVASYDWFKLTTPVTPSDEFTGSGLDTCRWSSIVRHDPAGYTVGDGKLTLPAAHGDFFAAGANNNPNIVLQPAPSGPWTMTTRMTFNPNENYEQAGLLVYGDDANYVKADLVHSGGRAVEFLREVADVASGFGGTVALPGDFPTTVELRVVSDGTTLTASYRPVGGQWAPFGEPAPLSGVPNPKVGVYANDSNATVASRDDALFEFFRLVPGLPDATPPVTTHTLAPAAPDGQAGWYRSPVAVTLATEPGATTEYKVGDGAYQPYSAPFTLGEDGTHVVGYRSTDAAENVEAAKTVTVKVDRTAPSSAATVSGDGPVTITLAGADPAGGSGLGGLEYRLDGGAWTAYGGPVTVTAAGDHTFEHRATDVAGNVGTIGSEAFSIDGGGGPGAPTVQAFADPPAGPAPLAVTFSADGLDPDGGALSYHWEFSDGDAFGQSVQRTFSAVGDHTATVTVTDEDGETASDEVTVTVTAPGNEPPEIVEASADRTSGAAPLEVWFQAVARDPDGDHLTYRWEFGDGPGSALGAEADHTYLTPGSFTARVTVSDPAGASVSQTIAIAVSDPPGNRPPSVDAAAAPRSGHAPLDVVLTAEGTDPDGDALTYAWDFGDGSATAQGRRARHTYTHSGTFTARVTATDAAGATASDTVDVVVGDPAANQAPTVVAAADPAGGTAPLKVSFTADGSDPDGDALSYAWNFGDGGQGGGQKVTHTFAAAGSYAVTVTVRDAAGGTGVATLPVVVTAPLRAAGAPPAAAAKGAAIVSIAPATVASLARRGLKASVRCGPAGTARASLWVSRAAAKRLGLPSRRLGSRSVACAPGKTVTIRVKVSRAARKRLAGRQAALRVGFRFMPDGAATLKRTIKLQAVR
jgi:cytochrome c